MEEKKGMGSRSMSKRSEEIIDQMVIKDRYIVEETIGSGTFGDIHIAIDTKTDSQVAVKLEKSNAKYPQLLREAQIMKSLNSSKQCIGIPKIIEFGKHKIQRKKGYNFMVMELLGPSLEDVFNSCGRKFSLKTTLMISYQLLNRVEFIHSKDFIHRDLKPDNLLIGTGSKIDKIYSVDFGLSKKYYEEQQGHVRFRDDLTLTGTARYASVNNHVGFEQSRRDDLESIGYTLIYFLKGRLPWQKVEDEFFSGGGGRRRRKDHFLRKKEHDQIYDMKMNMTVSSLCKGLPKEFSTYMSYVRNLQFGEKPNYTHLRNIFTRLFVKKKFCLDFKFDWMSANGKSIIYNNTK